MSSFFHTGAFALNKVFSGTGNFSTAGQWDLSTLPTASDNVTITGICTMTSSFATTGSLTVSGTLQLGVYSMTSGDLQGAGTITSSSGTPALTTGSNNTSTTFSGVIGTGVIAFTKNGTGALTLSGNNTYTGTTTIAAGTIKLNHTNALGTIAGATSVTSGAVLDLNGINYSNAEILTLNGTGISTGGALINSNAAAASYAGNITLGSSSRITADNPMTLSGVISGSPDLTTAGTSTLLLSGTNTNTGLNTLIAGSTLKLGNAAALGGVLAADYTVINTGAVLDLNGINYSSAELLTLNGTGISGGGALTNSSGTAATFAGPITLGSASIINGEMGTIALTGTLTGATFGLSLDGAAGGSATGIISGAGTTLTKLDAGTWTLSGLNTYTGATTVSAGILRATNNTIAASTNGAFGNNASGLLLNGGTIQTNVATFSRPITVTASNSGLDAYGSARTISSTITLSTAGTYNLNAGGTTVVSAAGQNLTLSGVISYSTGTLSLTKIGTSNLLFGSQAVTLKDLTISTGALTSTSGVLSLAGNYSNNGTYTHNSGNVNFNGAGINTVTGSSTTAFNTITINKGTDYTSNILDVQSLMTMTAGGLTLTNGTFKLSSASVITPFTVNIPLTPFLIPATAGIWCNGGTLNPADMHWSIDGLVRVSAGSVTVGTTALNIFGPQGNASIIIEGGNLITSGRVSNPGIAWPFVMTGGIFTINTVGTPTADRPPFYMDVAGCAFSMSGGTMVIQRPGGTAGQNLGFHSLATSGTGFTGGTLQMGNASTPAASTIGITSTNPIYNLTVNSANVTAQLQSALTVSNAVTISAGTLSANNLNLTLGGNWINNGIFTPGSGRVTFSGAGTHTVTGSATTAFNTITIDKGTDFTSNILDVQSLITMTAGGLKLTNGTFKLSSNSTITVFTVDNFVLPYLIPATAGIWVNGGTVSTIGHTTAAGLIRVSNGTFNMGNAADVRLFAAWVTIIIEGGAFNISGRLTRREDWEGHYFTMSGGTFTVGTLGNTSPDFGPFIIDNTGSSFTMSGGTIVVCKAGGAALDYTNLAGTTNVTGGTIQIGDASTPASNTIRINSTTPMWNLVINGSNSTVAQLVTSPLTVKNDITITNGTLDLGSYTADRATAGGTLTISNGAALKIGGTNTLPANYSTHVFGATSSVEYNGTTQSVAPLNSTQNYGNLIISGSGTKTLAGTNNVAGNLTVSAGTFDLGSYTANRATAGGTLTMSAGTILQIGGTNGVPSNYTTHSIDPTSTVEYNGVNQSVSAFILQNFGNLIISNTGTKTLLGSVGIAGDLTVSGGTFDLGTNTISRTTAGGTLTISSGAALKIGGTNTFPSNYSTHSIAATSTVEYSGTTQSIAALNSAQNYGNLIISNTGTKTLLSTVAIAGDLTVSGGTFDLAGYSASRSVAGGTLTLSGTATLKIGGTNTFPSNYTTHSIGATSTVEYSGTIQSVIALNSAQNYGNLVISGSVSITMASNLIIEGDLTIPNGWLKMNGKTLNRSSAGGTLTLSGTGTLTVNIAFPANFATHSIAATSTIEYGAGTFSVIALNSSQNYGNLKFSGGGFKSLAANTGVAGDLTIVSPGSLSMITYTLDRTSAGGTLTVANGGTLSIGGTNTFPANYSTHVIGATSNITYSGSVQSVAALNSAQNYGNLNITNSGIKTLTATIGVAGNLSITTGEFDMGSFTADRTSAGGTLTVNNGTLKIGGTNTLPSNYTAHSFSAAVNTVEYYGSNQTIATLNSSQNYYHLTISGSGTKTLAGSITVSGNWTNNGGTFIPGSNTVTFNGTGTKSLGGSSPTSFYNLTLNTVASTDVVQLSNNATVTAVLSLTNGVLDLNSKSLSVTSGLAGAITRTSGYILSEKTDNSSKIIWSIGSNLTSHTFPFGTAAGTYIPFIMNLTAGDIGNATVSTYPTAANNTPYPSTPVTVTNMYSSTGSDNSANTVDRFWQINKDGASGTATITFTSTSAEMGTILLPTAQRYDSSTNGWQAPLAGQTNTATSATVPGVTTFSPWTMSSQSAILPIELVSFNAISTNPFVTLTWVTESEINSDYYTIERTIDESTFETVCQVKAAGQSMQTLNYQTRDMNPSPGLSYYRLKEVDLDGTYSYSDLVAIEITTLAEQISVFPNPVTNGMITIKVENHVSETLDISVVDLRGQVLFETKNKMDEGQQSSFVVDQLGNLPKGLYILKISGAAEIYTKKIAIY